MSANPLKPLLELVSQLKTSQQNEEKRETEYILSFSTKKQILDIIRASRLETKMGVKPTDQEYRTWGFVLSVLNDYLFYDPLLATVFDYVCVHTTNKEELTSRATIKVYPCPDVIPQPFYQFIKDTVDSQSKVLGDMYSCHVYVMYMIGKVIGFAVVQNKTSVCFHFESPLIQSVFQKKNPTLVMK
jgi:hypothetical protein